MKTLIIYPHGIGDGILCTPALKMLKEKGEYIGFAMLERFKSSELFKNNPNIDKLYYTKDAWNDFPSYKIGCDEIEKSMKQISKEYDVIVFIKHSKVGSKIMENAIHLGLPVVGIYRSLHTEIYPSREDVAFAEGYVSKIGEPFGFIHSKTGVKAKDLPDGYGQKFLKEKFNLNKCIEVGKTFGQEEFNINIQFEIMRRAKAVCLCDSAFYHACHAMDKPVDFAYFARGQGVYDRVKPIHVVKENIVYKLD